MSKKLSKSLCILVLVVFTISMISGCVAGKDPDKGNTETTKDSKPVVNKTGLPIVNEPITLKMMVSKHRNDKITWAEKPCIIKAEEETGIKFEWTEIQGSAWNEMLGVTLASKDLPDAIIGGANLPLYADSFLPLNNLLGDYAPYAQEYFNKHPEIKFASTLPDGNLYSLPLVHITGNNAPVGYAINKVWLDNLSLDIPETTEELYNVLKAFKEKDPNKNNEQDEIPYSCFQNENTANTDSPSSINTMIWNFGLVNDGIGNPFTGTSDYVMAENGKVLFVPTDERFYDFLEYMSKLFSEGLMDRDSFVQKNQDYKAKGNKGLIGFFTYGGYEDTVVGTEYSDQYINILPMKDKNGNHTIMPTKISGDFTYSVFKITTACKYPEALLRLWDYANSTFENRLLWSWGVENEAWEKLDDGKIAKITSSFPEGFSTYSELRNSRSTGMSGFWIWDEDDYNMFSITEPRDKKYLEKGESYKPYLKKDLIPLGQDELEVTQDRATMSTEIKNYITNFVAESVIKGIDRSRWETHLENCRKLDVEKFVNDYQNYYDRAQEMLK